MKEIRDINEVKEIGLRVLLVIHHFCVENGINYSLAYGSLLGAVRHKGFIPWDDDIDICLLRKDYNRLIKSFPSILNNVEIISLERNDQWNKPYAVAYDNRTEKEEFLDYDVKGWGIGVDIFPLDHVPNNKYAWYVYHKIGVQLQRLFLFKTIKIKSDRSIIKNLFIILFKILLIPFSSRFVARVIDIYSKLLSKESNYVFDNVEGYPDNDRIESSVFYEFGDVLFENKVLRSVANYDKYLKISFGDYMELPPIDKRETHHSYTAYWKI